MKRRARPLIFTENYTSDVPLDEVEQDELVNKLEQEAMAQMKDINYLFGTICKILALTCCLLALVLGSNHTERIHGMYAAGLHIAANLHFNSTNTQVYDYILLLASLLPLLPLLFLPLASSEFHWGLQVTSLISSFGAIAIRRENESTKKEIHDLHAAKYRYKSL